MICLNFWNKENMSLLLPKSALDFHGLNSAVVSNAMKY